MKSDLTRLFDQFESFAVGYGPVFREFRTLTTGYPPHNIIKNTENVFILELAVAGFKKNEIKVEEHQGVVTITGTKGSFSEDNHDQYQYRGIANRSFSKSFRIAEFFEIVDAKMEDGMLSVTFMKNMPEEESPKIIAIK